jgi:hypothetical protein
MVDGEIHENIASGFVIFKMKLTQLSLQDASTIKQRRHEVRLGDRSHRNRSGGMMYQAAGSHYRDKGVSR